MEARINEIVSSASRSPIHDADMKMLLSHMPIDMRKNTRLNSDDICGTNGLFCSIIFGEDVFNLLNIEYHTCIHSLLLETI